MGIEEGSTGLLFSNEDQSELFTEELEKWFWGEVYGVFVAMNNGNQKTYARKILRIAKMQGLFNKDWEAIEAVDMLGNRKTTVSAKTFFQAVEKARKGPFGEDKVLLGTIKKIDTHPNRRTFTLKTLLGEEISVSYPLGLEEEVCRYLRKTVRAYGTALVDPTTFRILSFKLKAIEPYGITSREDLERARKRPQELRRFEGIFQEVASARTTEEITEWQKETLWGN